MTERSELAGKGRVAAMLGRAGFARVASKALVGAVLGVALLVPAPAFAQQMDWINKAFGINHGDTRRVNREASTTAKAPLQDLRTGEAPLRSEAMLQALDLAYGRYKIIAKRGGWPQVPTARMIRPGDDDERVPIVRKRLFATGELASTQGSQAFNYDGALEAAVRKFQQSHGLNVTGRIDRATIAAMNVTVEERLAQIKLNYDRIAALIDRVGMEDRYVLVNVPAYQLEAIEGGKIVQRHRVISGRVERQTPDVKTAIRALNFFPYWKVPDSIAKLDLAPRLMKEPDYLQKEQIRVLNGSFTGTEVDASQINWAQFDPKTMKFRQDPGPQNALGLVRLDMPNEHGVYMHDTPMKPLFGRSQRAFSAGCVRVESVFDLAAWVAQGEPGMDRGRVDEIVASGTPVDVVLSRPVPVYFAYITAWASPKGMPMFRPDIYGRDGGQKLASAENDDSDEGPPPAPGLTP